MYTLQTARRTCTVSRMTTPTDPPADDEFGDDAFDPAEFGDIADTDEVLDRWGSGTHEYDEHVDELDALMAAFLAEIDADADDDERRD